MTTQLTSQTHQARTATRQIRVTIAAILAVFLSLLVPATASAQGKELRTSETTKEVIAQDTPTYTLSANAATNDTHTVIFEAPPKAPDYGVAAGPPSCAFDCIERAWLTANLSSTALTLTVETDVDATIRYEVGTHLPAMGTNGVPYFPLPVSANQSPTETDNWTTTVSGLAADTNYYVIVEASDGGGSHIETGVVRTITPANDGIKTFDGTSDAGCTLECITFVDLSVDPDEPHRIDWIVETLVPANFVIHFSDQEFEWNDGVPFFSSYDANAAKYELSSQFTGSVDGLESATRYYAIITASDPTGATDYFVSAIDTPTQSFDLVYAPLRTIVHENGDNIGKSKLSFRWNIGEAPFLHLDSRGPKRIADGESFYFAEHNQYVVHSVAETAVLPNFAIRADDHDPFQFLSYSHGAQVHHWTWNGFYGAQRVMDLDDFPTCGSFDEINDDHPFADAACIAIESHPGGVPNEDSAVHFTTILAIHTMPGGSHPVP